MRAGGFTVTCEITNPRPVVGLGDAGVPQQPSGDTGFPQHTHVYTADTLLACTYGPTLFSQSGDGSSSSSLSSAGPHPGKVSSGGRIIIGCVESMDAWMRIFFLGALAPRLGPSPPAAAVGSAQRVTRRLKGRAQRT